MKKIFLSMLSLMMLIVFFLPANAAVSAEDGMNEVSRPINTTESDEIDVPEISEMTMSTRGVNLTWTAVEAADLYAVYRKAESESNYTRIDTIEETTYLDKSALAGKRYVYAVKAYDSLTQQYSATSNRINALFNPFSDVSESSAHFSKIMWAYNQAIVGGTSATTFSPKDTCKRRSIALMLWKLIGRPEPDGTESFSDVDMCTSNEKRAIQYFYEIDIFGGTGNGCFSPDGQVTRIQAVIMLWKTAGKPNPSSSVNPFTDINNLTANSRKAVLWAYENGITKGTSSTTFSPDAFCVREQLCTLLYKYNSLDKRKLYFGQFHSHTDYSDGLGSLESALDHISNLPKSENISFLAFTDHSQYFDNKTNPLPEGALYDMSLANEKTRNLWNTYKQTVAQFNETHDGIIAIAAFEMTWKDGPGHINTYNTPGLVSRYNKRLDSKTNYSGLKAYYNLLKQKNGESSVSMFNHPGTRFGTFADFSFLDPIIDERINLIEVGNGSVFEGKDYYSRHLEYYTMALDIGWHLGPNNNQDNHEGLWGNANDHRSVILTDDFSEQGIYEAMRKMRVYATEDKNLEIHYRLNGQPLGSIMADVPRKLHFDIYVNDPDSSDTIIKVEIVADSGAVAYAWDNRNELAKGILKCDLNPDYSYYFVRVTEKDNDIAVTAPIWIGENQNLGIFSFETVNDMHAVKKQICLSTTLFNSQSSDAVLTSLTYTVDGSVVVASDTEKRIIPSSSRIIVNCPYSVNESKTITVTATIECEGRQYTFTRNLNVDPEVSVEEIPSAFEEINYFRE